jgi:hypothetical protein
MFAETGSLFLGIGYGVVDARVIPMRSNLIDASGWMIGTVGGRIMVERSSL